jgi:hypothetical protein
MPEQPINAFTDVFGTDWSIEDIASETRQDLAVRLTQYMRDREVFMYVTDQWIMFADESEISDYAMSSLQTLNKVGVMKGVGESAEGRTIIDPKGIVTRAQAADILHAFMEILAQFST